MTTYTYHCKGWGAEKGCGKYFQEEDPYFDDLSSGFGSCPFCGAKVLMIPVSKPKR